MYVRKNLLEFYFFFKIVEYFLNIFYINLRKLRFWMGCELIKINL